MIVLCPVRAGVDLADHALEQRQHVRRFLAVEVQAVIEPYLVRQKRMDVEIVHGVRDFQLGQQRVRNKGRHEQAIDDFHLLAGLDRVRMRFPRIDDEDVAGLDLVPGALEQVQAVAADDEDELDEFVAVLVNIALDRPRNPERKFRFHVIVAR